MAMVVTEPCYGCKYTDCVVVCPTSAFREGQMMVYIHPGWCTECEACIPECPTDAIFNEDDVPAAWQAYVSLNRELSKSLPEISERRSTRPSNP